MNFNSSIFGKKLSHKIADFGGLLPFQEYYEELVEETKCKGIRVKNSKILGKGTFPI